MTSRGCRLTPGESPPSGAFLFNGGPPLNPTGTNLIFLDGTGRHPGCLIGQTLIPVTSRSLALLGRSGRNGMRRRGAILLLLVCRVRGLQANHSLGVPARKGRAAQLRTEARTGTRIWSRKRIQKRTCPWTRTRTRNTRRWNPAVRCWPVIECPSFAHSYHHLAENALLLRHQDVLSTRQVAILLQRSVARHDQILKPAGVRADYT